MGKEGKEGEESVPTLIFLQINHHGCPSVFNVHASPEISHNSLHTANKVLHYFTTCKHVLLFVSILSLPLVIGICLSKLLICKISATQSCDCKIGLKEQFKFRLPRVANHILRLASQNRIVARSQVIPNLQGYDPKMFEADVSCPTRPIVATLALSAMQRISRKRRLKLI